MNSTDSLDRACSGKEVEIVRGSSQPGRAELLSVGIAGEYKKPK